MANVTETRDSGIELLDTELEEIDDDTEAAHFRTDREIEVQVGTSAGNPVVTYADHFIAASIEMEMDEDDPTRMMMGVEEVDESAVFISNEDGEMGGGFVQIEEGSLEDALTEFEDEHL